VPDDQAVQALLGLAHRCHHAIEHLVADGVHLGLEGEDADAGVDRRQAPQADTVVLEQGFAGLLGRQRTVAEDGSGKSWRWYTGSAERGT
jgi:hypothetical protein